MKKGTWAVLRLLLGLAQMIMALAGLKKTTAYAVLHSRLCAKNCSQRLLPCVPVSILTRRPQGVDRRRSTYRRGRRLVAGRCAGVGAEARHPSDGPCRCDAGRRGAGWPSGQTYSPYIYILSLAWPISLYLSTRWPIRLAPTVLTPYDGSYLLFSLGIADLGQCA